MAQAYPWLVSTEGTSAFADRFPAPEGFSREPAAPDSFGAWLRGLPLEPGRPDVRLFDGTSKANQRAQVAVVRLDVGKRDLQQCADAVMRLRAEYLWSVGRAKEVCFTLSNGDPAPWERWAKGERPSVRGNEVRWTAAARSERSHVTFRRYLDFVFAYAGSASLSSHDLEHVGPARVSPGDVFIQGGFPGHAVAVVDVARNKEGEAVMALAQSYMPAQDVHVLDNPSRPGSPWYPVKLAEPLVTPEWTFAPGALRRFRAESCAAAAARQPHRRR